MKGARLAYFEDVDVLHLAITDEPEAQTVEVSPNVTAELNDDGELMGIEILNATGNLRDTVLESVQGRLLQLSK
jgi:uncharacterized protein YuzE